MEARNRALPEWFNRIRTGQIVLPRFQRFQAWGHNEISDLLETVLQGLPAGASLILEIGDKQPFVSRTMVGAPEPTERTTEHLLDGQQRLTALWRSFHEGYEDRTYFVTLEVDEEHGNQEVPRIYGQSRWMRNGKRYPMWAESPAEVHERNYIPLRLLCPGDIDKEITSWCMKATGQDLNAVIALRDQISKLRERVTTFNLPFLSLPTSTPKDIALKGSLK